LPHAADSILVEETGSHRQEGADSMLPAPTISVSDDGALAGDAPAAAEGGVGLDQGDPLAEADFHMAYGLYDQAADLVSQAISREPERRELKLKLLEVYFVWGNKQKFEQLATELSGTRGGAMPGEWEKIVIMGRQIAPEHALFAAAGSVAGAAGGVDLNLEGGQNRIDFNLMGEPSVAAGDGGIDLDLGEALADLRGMEAGARPPGESGVDFLLDTPVRGEGGELHTHMMPAASGLQAFRNQAGPPGEGPTAELPLLDPPEQGTIRMKLEGPAAKPASNDARESTAELALDDLGLDIGAMEAAGGGANKAVGGEEEIVLQTGGELPEDLESGPEGNWLLQGTEDSAEHPALGGESQPDSGGTTVGYIEALSQPEQATQKMVRSGELLTGLAANNAITAVMPAADSQLAATGRLASLSGIDSAIDEPISVTQELSVAPAVLPEMDPPTMSEVGTKLDLARAYMDMGDPEGARSILDEVLAEGSASQKLEARRLIDSLPG
jgi:pilus assembly protein FimV